MSELLLLIVGLLGLLVSTELIIRAAINIAEHFKISQLFIGLTILAIGTDLPELVVTITAAIHRLQGIETSDLVIGAAIGSSFGQIALTLGIIGLFASLYLTKRELIRDGLMMIGSVALLFLVGFDGTITQLEGFAFIIIYILYFLTLQREERIYEKIKRAPHMDIAWVALSLIAGFFVIIFSSQLVVDNAIALAESWGVAQSLVGALLVGLGTSLPELAISLGALRKGALRLSVGNLIGSNIFDVLFTLGVGSAISGFNVSKSLLSFDIPFLFIVSVMVILFFIRRRKIERIEAVALIIFYMLYVLLKLLGF